MNLKCATSEQVRGPAAAGNNNALTLVEAPQPAPDQMANCYGVEVPTWPRLDSLGLSRRAAAERLRGIGGSDANIVMSGDAVRILRLWREKRGEAAPDTRSV